MKCPECGREIKEGELCFFCGKKMVGRNIGLMFYIPALIFFFTMLFISKGISLALFDYAAIAAVVLSGLFFLLRGSKK